MENTWIVDIHGAFLAIFAFITFYLLVQLQKSDKFSSELMTILQNCIFLAAATSCPIQAKNYVSSK